MQTDNNNQTTKDKQFNLEERTLVFSKSLILLCKSLPKHSINNNLIDQLVRSGTSIGANYREANDSLGKKDFVLRLRIARKEAKETSYWLELLKESNSSQQIESLIDECIQLRNILSAIIKKVEDK